MSLRTLLLSLLALACTPPAAPEGAPVTQMYSLTQRLGAGAPLDGAAPADGSALVLGTTRGVAAFSPEGAQRWLVETPAWSSSVSVSSDGRRVAAGDNAGGSWVLDGETGGVLWSGRGQGRVVVALRPDGAQLAVGDHSRTLRVLDSATGQVLRTVDGFQAEIKGVAWRPDGGAVAAVDWEGVLVVADTGGSRQLTDAPEPAYGLAWSPDGRLIAAAGRTVVVWDAATGAVVSRWEPELGRAERVAFSPDSRVLAAGLEHGRVVRWTLDSGEALPVLGVPGDAAPALVWRQTLWAVSDLVAGLDPASGERTALLPLLSSPSRTSTTGEVVALASAHGAVLLPLGGGIGRAAAADRGRMSALGFGPDGRYWLGGSDGPRALDPRTGSVAKVEARAAGACALRPDGGVIAGVTLGEDGTWSLVLWDTISGQETARVPSPLPVPDGLAWSADGDLLAVRGGESAAVVDTSLAVLSTRNRVVRRAAGLAWSPVDALVASGTTDQHVVLWDPRSGAVARTLRGVLPGKGASVAAWRGDGTRLAVATEDGAGDAVFLWDTASGRQLAGPLPGLGTRAVVRALAWRPDGELLAGAVGTGANRGAVFLWDGEGALLQVIPSETGTVADVAWGADGQRMVAAISDGTAGVFSSDR